MLVWERMTRNPYTVTGDLSVEDALRRMRKLRVRRFPVVDCTGQLVGIVAERDLLHVSPSPATTLSVHEVQYLLAKLSVSKIMQRQIITVRPDTPVEDAAQIMAERKIGGLPVVRTGALVGIITETDLFKAFQEVLGQAKSGVRLTLLVSNRAGMIAKLTSAITAAGGNVVGLAASSGEDPSSDVITLKVAGVSAQDTLTRLLRPLVLEVIDVRETAPGSNGEHCPELSLVA